MYSRKQTHLIYGLTLLVAMLGMITSCQVPQAAARDSAAAPASPFVTPYVPAGQCAFHYTMGAGGGYGNRCTLALPAGIDPQRISVLATVSSGAWTVQSWLTDTFVFDGTVNASFELRNVGSKANSATAVVTIAVAQTLTPTAATVGVE